MIIIVKLTKLTQQNGLMLSRFILPDFTALQCIAFIEMFNLHEHWPKKCEPVVVNHKLFPAGLTFYKNGNSTYAFKKSVKELVQKILATDFFVDLPMHPKHDMVKKLYRFLDYIAESKKVSIHKVAENLEDGERTMLYQLAIDIAYPLLERYSHIIVLELNK